jgi:hypothetical protein
VTRFRTSVLELEEKLVGLESLQSKHCYFTVDLSVGTKQGESHPCFLHILEVLECRKAKQ